MLLLFIVISICETLLGEFMLSNSKIIRNYSEALFSVAKNLSKESLVLEQISIFTDIFHKSALVKEAICSPIISADIKRNLVDIVAKKCKFETISKQFLYVLIKHARCALLSQIARDLKSIILNSNGIKEVSLSSTYQMTKKDIKSVEEFLEKKLNSKIELSYDVDPALIGGIVIKYDSNLIDCSMSGALNSVKDLASKSKIQFGH